MSTGLEDPVNTMLIAARHFRHHQGRRNKITGASGPERERSEEEACGPTSQPPDIPADALLLLVEVFESPCSIQATKTPDLKKGPASRYVPQVMNRQSGHRA